MEESDTIPIFRPEEKSNQEGKPGAGLRIILVFLPLVFLLALCFYAWQLKTVFVVEGEAKKQFSTFCRTVGDFLEKNGLQVGLYDQLDPALEEEITNGQVIRIQRAFPVTLVVDGEAREVWTCSLTAAELLKEQGVVLKGEETISPLPDTILKPHVRQEVRVVHVSRGGPEERPAMLESQARDAVDDSVPAEDLSPAENIVSAENNTLSRGGRVYEFVTSLEVSATAYCPGTPESGCPIDARGASQCTGFYNDGYTATGVLAAPGDGSINHPHLIAVDPAVIPLKSLIYMEGYGFARAEDTGAAIKGKSIDILFGQHDEARLFGRQKLKIYILDPHFAPNFH